VGQFQISGAAFFRVAPSWLGHRARPGSGTPVVEAGGEPVHLPDRLSGRADQQRPGIRRDLPAVEGGHDPAALDHFIRE
jgi:hypothetical protein